MVSCALHGYVILPSKVLSHFNEEHRDETTAEERRDIQAAVNELVATGDYHKDYTDFVIPKVGVNAFKGLKIFNLSY